MAKTISPIAVIHTDFPEKFGIPRQSGILDSLVSTITFLPEYRDINALRGIEGFSHLWLIWDFSENPTQEKFHPTVRPPRLGGNTGMGVFATRSPFRPNGLGLSSVSLKEVKMTKDGPTLFVTGADLVDGTPIYDIKPYLPFTDCHADATGGFAEPLQNKALYVIIKKEHLALFPLEKQEALIKILENNPIPAYQKDGEREYGLAFADKNISFTVEGDTLTVTNVQNYSHNKEEL